MIELYPYLSAAGFGIAAASIVMAFGIIFFMVPDDDRDFLDPIPPGLRLFWPIIRFLSYFASSNLSADHLNKIDDKLQKSGVCYVFSAEDYFALCLFSAVTVPALTAVVAVSLGDVNPMYYLLAALGGFYLPEIWVRDTRLKRNGNIIRALPVFLEYMTMSVDAGLNFSGALRQAVDKGPSGAMKNEFKIVLRDIRSGLSRAEALGRMDERLCVSEISTFIGAVTQAEKMGSSIKKTLQVQTRQRLDERFQRAEKQAMEAPVKLVVPLVLFIFPVTFVILLYPIVIKFMNSGI